MPSTMQIDFTKPALAAPPVLPKAPVEQKPVQTVLPPTTSGVTAPASPVAPAGLVGSAMAPKPNIYNPDKIQAATAGVSNWNVNDDQLVEKRAGNLIKKDGEFMQRARAQADQQSAARGLINSSMAVGAAQTAVLDKAVDIGGRDAATYAQSAQFNAGEANRASMFNAGQSNQWNMNAMDKDWTGRENILDRTFKSGESEKDRTWQSGENATDRNWKTDEAATDRGWRTNERTAGETFQSGESSKVREFQAGQATTDREWKAGQSSEDRAARVDEYKFNAATQKEVKELDFKYQKELNSDNDTAKMYGTYVDEMYKIDTNPDLDASAKDALKATARQKFEGFAKIRGLKIDLNFGGSSDSPAGSPENDGGAGPSPGGGSFSAQKQDNFDEAAYLAANPDVANSWGSSAWEHYQQYGKKEGREFKQRGAQSSAPGGSDGLGGGLIGRVSAGAYNRNPAIRRER